MAGLKVLVASVAILSLGLVGASPVFAGLAEPPPAGQSAAQQTSFTNDDVVAMIAAGFAKETVIEAIRAHGSGFDVSLDGLVALKQAGVDEDIIAEILVAARSAKDQAPVSGGAIESSYPSGTGVYALVDGAYVPLASEPIEWRSSFWGGGRTTVGALTTTKLNARLPVLHSPFEVSILPELLVVCDTCETAVDYQLVRAKKDEDKREFQVSFQILEGRNEVWVARGGVDEDRVIFTGERVAPGRFRLKLSALEPGEYGFLAPSRGGDPRSLGSVMHTFRLVAP